MKIVIIGSGKIAQNIVKHLTEDIEVFGIYSRNLMTSSYLAEKCNAKVYKSLDEIKQDKKLFDFVYVATPHTSHYEYAKYFLTHEINVLIEKPIVTKVSEIEDLIKLKSRHNAFISEAMWSFICDPLFLIKEYLRDKKVKEVNLNFSIFKPHFNKKDRLFIPELKGGALFDIGIYLITMSYMFFGVPVSTSISSKVKKSIDIIDIITLHYSDFDVNIYTSFKSFKDSIYIKGEDFIIEAKHRAHAPNKIKITEKGNVKYIEGETSYNEEFRHIYKDISNGFKESTRISLNDNLEIMKIMEDLDKQIDRKEE